MPYPDGSYDGRAFSNNEEKGTVSPSLKNILKEVEDDVYNGFMLHQNPDLKRWEDQGVFLMNRVLTVVKGKANSHQNIGWEKFTNVVISTLSNNFNNIVFMLWGGNARAVDRFINEKNNLVLRTGHPSPLSANRGYWFGNKHFSKANKYLKDNNIQEIIW